MRRAVSPGSGMPAFSSMMPKNRATYANRDPLLSSSWSFSAMPVLRGRRPLPPLAVRLQDVPDHVRVGGHRQVVPQRVPALRQAVGRVILVGLGVGRVDAVAG